MVFILGEQSISNGKVLGKSFLARSSSKIFLKKVLMNPKKTYFHQNLLSIEFSLFLALLIKLQVESTLLKKRKTVRNCLWYGSYDEEALKILIKLFFTFNSN